MEQKATVKKKERNARIKKNAINVDMNPMVDLAFLLLTFFMLATTFSQPQTMELIMPVNPDVDDVQKEQAVKESRALNIVLSGKDQIYCYQGLTSPEVIKMDCNSSEVKTLLIDKKTTVQGLIVLIKAEESSRYENLIDILDELNQIGIERYAIAEMSAQDEAIIASYRQKK